MAKKYIDAELLKAMMQPEYDRDKALFKKTGEKYVDGIMYGLDLVEQFIDSLQQEQSSEDLEKETKRYLREECSSDDEPAISEIARHFYELGKQAMKEQMGEQARKELAKTDITLADLVAFDEGCKIGRRLERQDMLKDAWEREVKIDSGGYPYIDITAELYDYEHDVPLAKRGELVKIVIVKED